MVKVNLVYPDIATDREFPDMVRVLPVVERGHVTAVDVDCEMMVVVLDFEMEVTSTVKMMCMEALLALPVSVSHGIEDDYVFTVLPQSHVHM